MKNLLKSVGLFLIFVSHLSIAQQVTKKDTLSGTEVSVTMDKRISDLMDKAEANCAISRPTSSSSSSGISDGSESRGSRVNVPSRKLTTAEICRQNPRLMGYKIQLTVVKTNAEANEIKAYFRRRFPSIKAETDASLRPNYKILVGSYFKKETAAPDLRRIKEYFKNATIVQYYIFCAEAK